jgi:hypothetical protein
MSHYVRVISESLGFSLSPTLALLDGARRTAKHADFGFEFFASLGPARVSRHEILDTIRPLILAAPLIRQDGTHQRKPRIHAALFSLPDFLERPHVCSGGLAKFRRA